MVFSSPTFLYAFLPAVLLAVWLAPVRFRRYILVAASLLFYVWGVQEFVLVVLASTVVDWALARAIRAAHDRDDPRQAKQLLVAAVVQNLALLATFKYAEFGIEQLDGVADALGLGGVGLVSIALPIGISFFTFEKISYVVDVYRGDVEPRRDPLDVILFVSLFPRSIAGPIVRLREIQHDLREPRPRPEQIQEGALRFAWGLSKKVLIADQIAPVADAAFAAAGDGTLTAPAAWLGIIAYSLQLYFDFSGYSDMAIGIGMMLGFRLPENFRRPYSSASVTDFWRRWHMTLSRWFRDYVYIPLGGNRGGERGTYRNLLIVFGLTGLWHGAAWAFVLWGFYHGAWLLLERRMGWRAFADERPNAYLRRAATLLIVMMGWILFRAESLDLAGSYYAALFDLSAITPSVDDALTGRAFALLLVGAAIAFLPPVRAGGTWIAEAAGAVPVAVRVATVGVLLPIALLLALAGTFSPFLYFQF